MDPLNSIKTLDFSALRQIVETEKGLRAQKVAIDIILNNAKLNNMLHSGNVGIFTGEKLLVNRNFQHLNKPIRVEDDEGGEIPASVVISDKIDELFEKMFAQAHQTEQEDDVKAEEPEDADDPKKEQASSEGRSRRTSYGLSERDTEETVTKDTRAAVNAAERVARELAEGAAAAGQRARKKEVEQEKLDAKRKREEEITVRLENLEKQTKEAQNIDPNRSTVEGGLRADLADADKKSPKKKRRTEG